jgi:hypothetical protein
MERPSISTSTCCGVAKTASGAKTDTDTVPRGSGPPRSVRAAPRTSLAVVSETYGWFLHRIGEDAARSFRTALADFPRLELK